MTVPLAQAEIKALNGDVLESHSRGDTTSFEAPEPGLYVATHEDSSQYLAVNLASPQYSNLNKTVSHRKTGQPQSRQDGWNRNSGST